MGAEAINESGFMDGVVDGSIGWCRWCTHSSSSFLVPVGVAKLKDVVAHDDGESFNKSFTWNIRRDKW